MKRHSAHKAVVALLLLVPCLRLLGTPGSPAPRGIQIQPPHESATVVIKASDFEGDFFEVILPEVFHSDDKSLLPAEFEQHGRYPFFNKARWRKVEPGAWIASYSQPSVGAYSIQLAFHGDEIDMEWRLRNSSREEWRYVAGTAEFMFGKAPSFLDPTLERTYLFIGGKWVALKNADHSDGHWQWQWYLVKGYRAPKLMGIRPHAKDGWGLSLTEPDLGLVAVVSQDGRRVVGQVFERVQYIVQNATRGCVHPAAHFGDISPGQAISVRGKVYFLRGSLDDLLQRHRKDFPNPPQGLLGRNR